jgi:hypothetical protein
VKEHVTSCPYAPAWRQMAKKEPPPSNTSSCSPLPNSDPSLSPPQKLGPPIPPQNSGPPLPAAGEGLGARGNLLHNPNRHREPGHSRAGLGAPLPAAELRSPSPRRGRGVRGEGNSLHNPNRHREPGGPRRELRIPSPAAARGEKNLLLSKPLAPSRSPGATFTPSSRACLHRPSARRHRA